jgi:glycosyltransferase A (GT-A) superfamily protein (DUF2064 family)
MNGVFDWLRAKGHRNMVLIGGDLAPVPLRNLAETFTALEVAGERVVLGPSRDGGYYLVGMNRLTPQIFDGMTWSHDRVLAQTTAKLSASRIEFQLLPTWFDIDTIEDLRELKSHIGPECRAAMKQTLDLLRHLRIGEGGARLKS